MLEAHKTASASVSSAGAARKAPPTSGGVPRQSMLANVLNPKAALFFVAVLPSS